MPGGAIVLSGDPRSRGVEYGRRLAPDIQRFLSDHCARLNLLLDQPVSEKRIFAELGPYAAAIERELPSLADELVGLAEGAGISYEQAVLLQVRREILMRLRPGAARDCSTLALKNPAVLAQTIDLNGALGEFCCVVRIAPWRTAPEILMVCFAGLLGYLGMNSHGLSVAINMVSSGDWRPGVSPYLLSRQLLELENIEQCLDAIDRIPRSSSRSLTICDRARSVTVEMTSTSRSILEGDRQFHTNHFLSESLLPSDTINFLAKGSSVHRLKRLESRAATLPARFEIAEVFELFADHDNYPVGLCSHAEGNVRRTETVATVAMCPTEGAMYVRRGLPCQTKAIERYTLGQPGSA